jgi:transposase-like protein
MEVNITMASGEKKCEYCGSKESSLALNEEGNMYRTWTRNPYEEDSWICGKCYRTLLYLKARPLTHFRRRKLKKERK